MLTCGVRSGDDDGEERDREFARGMPTDVTRTFVMWLRRFSWWEEKRSWWLH